MKIPSRFTKKIVKDYSRTTPINPGANEKKKNITDNKDKSFSEDAVQIMM